jgi:hypothetical protein
VDAQDPSVVWDSAGRRQIFSLRFSTELAAVVRIKLQIWFPAMAAIYRAAMWPPAISGRRLASVQCRLGQSHLASDTAQWSGCVILQSAGRGEW